jgi:hypothetical protein
VSTATTWRDLADQLTPDQIVDVERFDEQIRRESLPCDMSLNYARQFARLNVARLVLADMPAPPDATRIGDWEEMGEGEWYRSFMSWSCTTEKVLVEVEGHQYNDGRIERWIIDHSGEEPMTARDTRERAEALLAAAAELDRLNG